MTRLVNAEVKEKKILVNDKRLEFEVAYGNDGLLFPHLFVSRHQ